MIVFMQIFAGLVVGAAMAAVHLWLTRLAAQRTVAGRGWVALLGFPLRVALVAGVLFALSQWSAPALLSGLLGFGINHRLRLRRLARDGDAA